MPFYLQEEDLREKILQGDGWRGFVAINFHTGERKTVSGVILSNSCDIASENVRDLPVNVLFSPLIEVQRYKDLLRAVGKTDAKIQDTVINIQKQLVTNIFYLPECPGFIPASLILLDDIHAHPLQDFLAQTRQSLFTLNQPAFYLFVIKLSIHLTRFQEGIKRFAAA